MAADKTKSEKNNEHSVQNLTPEEKLAVKEFIHDLSQENAFGDGFTVSEEEAVRFLMARKFEVGRAVSLYHSHVLVQRKFDLEIVDPNEEPLHTELHSGKFSVLSGKDEDGATICLFHSRMHFPNITSHTTVLRSLVFQLDEVMKSEESQRNGLTLIYNMISSGYQNFDFDLAMKVLHLLKGGYPARLKHVYVLMAPFWFRASMVVLSSFLREKIRDRVRLIQTLSELHKFIPGSSLPVELGGNVHHDHEAWIERCVNNSKWGLNNSNAESSSDVLNISIDRLETPKSSSDLPPDKPPRSTDPPPDKILRASEPPEKPPRVDVSLPLPVRNLDSDIPPVVPPRNRTVGPPSRPLPDPPSESKQATSNLVPAINGSLSDSESESLDVVSENRGRSLEEFVEHMRSVKKQGVHKEYDILRSMPPHGTFESTLLPVNLRKNRYNNILSFEETRVKLNKDPNDPYSDYINANYVDGYKKKQRFICTQGPYTQTYFDFWRMIWEKKVMVVVMVTRCVEKGRVKCGQYWPKERDATNMYGYMAVTNVTEDITEDYTITELLLYNNQEQQERTVVHIQFTCWPDFGVLPTAQPIIDVISLIEYFHNDGIQTMKRKRMKEFQLNNHDSEAGHGSEAQLEIEDSGEYMTPTNQPTQEQLLNEAINDVTDDKNNFEREAMTYVNDLWKQEQPQAIEDSGEYTSLNNNQPAQGDVEEFEESGEYTNLETKNPRFPVEHIPEPPVVIHCSAGVGRTGTFCCLANNIERFNTDSEIDIFSTVKKIREERAFSIQTPEQYEFCYRGILEYVISKQRKEGVDSQSLENFLFDFKQSDLNSESD